MDGFEFEPLANPPPDIMRLFTMKSGQSIAV
jgi:hypothetical protein